MLRAAHGHWWPRSQVLDARCAWLQVFAELARIGPVLPPEEEAAVTCHWPFRTVELPGEPHPGLRAYPFLGQVCK